MRRIRSIFGHRFLSISYHHTLIPVAVCCLGFLFCEYLIYYVTIWQCSWPVITCGNDGERGDLPLKAMILADTHVLGPWAHWLDKLRREWQMWRSFQTAVYLLQPAVIFILGDLFDKADVTSAEQFDEDLKRFRSIFDVPSHIPVICAAGNHDIGFHYMISEYTRARFERQFTPKSVQYYALHGVHFVVLNSMAFEGDGCDMCSEAEKSVSSLAGSFNRTDIRPVILQHFPLYRQSDSACTVDDAAPLSEKDKPFRPQWDCLSKQASKTILDKLMPRVVFSGHTHHGCYREHATRNVQRVPEWTVSSFNWRNKINPSFLMVSFCKSDFRVGRCQLPNEHTVYYLYGFVVFTVVLYCFVMVFRFIRCKANAKLKT